MYKFIAHRGNNDNNCENKFDCLKDIVNYDYIYGIEVDVRESLDRVLVLNHNSFIKKNHSIYFISKTNYKNLNLTTLKYLLDNDYTKKIIILDIKDNIDINKFYKFIKKYYYLNIYICSFNYDFVYKLKSNYKLLKVGLIIGYNMNINKDINIFDFLSIHYNVKKIFNKDLFIWTVNNYKLLDKLPNNLGIITDNSYDLKNKDLQKKST